MIKNIFFDVMGVVFTVGDDTNDLLVPYIQKFNKNISRQQICELYLDASLGKISSMEFWLKMGVKNSDIKQIEEEYLNENLKIDWEIIETIKYLKNHNYKIGLLSNDVSEWSRYLRNKFNLDSLLDYCIISGDVKIRKPDTEIYEHLVKEFGIDPKECIFIDDRIKNLVPAEELGFKTILFDRDAIYKNVSYNTAHSSGEIVKIIDNINER